MSLPESGASASTAKAKPLSTEEMEAMAKKLRRHIITMTGKAGSGHPGGSLSAAEIITALYFRILRHKQTDHKCRDSDRFILRKRHAAPKL